MIVMSPVRLTVPPTVLNTIPLPVLLVERVAVAFRFTVVLVISNTARLSDVMLPAVVVPILSVPVLLARMPEALFAAILVTR
ncbi:MAG: hypothetical protein HPM95_10730 [Alphaproteobacteria bacterium]|nr:hypothetical protein [Alphaproteobacteria bacterium]